MTSLCYLVFVPLIYMISQAVFVSAVPLIRQEGQDAYSLSKEDTVTKPALLVLNKTIEVSRQQQQGAPNHQKLPIPVKTTVNNPLVLGDGLTKDLLRQFFQKLKRFPSLMKKILTSQGYYEVGNGQIAELPSNNASHIKERRNKKSQWQNKEHDLIQPDEPQQLQKEKMLQTNVPKMLSNKMKTIVAKPKNDVTAFKSQQLNKLQHVLQMIKPHPQQQSPKQSQQMNKNQLHMRENMLPLKTDKRDHQQVSHVQVPQNSVAQTGQDINVHPLPAHNEDDKSLDTSLIDNNRNQVLPQNKDYIYEVETLPSYYYYNYDDELMDQTKETVENKAKNNKEIDDKSPSQVINNQTDKDKLTIVVTQSNQTPEVVVSQDNDSNNPGVNDVISVEMQLSNLHS